MSTDPIDSAPRIDVRDVLLAAVVDHFFTPVMTGWTFPPAPPGLPPEYAPPPQPTFRDAPLVQIASAMFDKHRDAIVDAVFERLDLDDLATRIATKVAAELAQGPVESYSHRALQYQQGEKVRARAQEIVAQRLAEDTLAKLREQEDETR